MKTDSSWRRPPGASGPARDPELDEKILRSAIELLAEGGFPALSMDKAAARAGVGKATVYRRWRSRVELAADALDRAAVAAGHRAVRIGPGRLRQELIDTLMQVEQCTSAPHNELVATLLATARHQPEIFALVRERYVDTMHRLVGEVLAHAVERGDLPPPPPSEESDGKCAIEISAAVALLIHWQLVRDGEALTEDHVISVVDRILLPLVSRSGQDRM
ncbi:DNA-binding transcriptional regulator, AcrR family [Nonomuraea maritima]|uniref:DNA-binding transcriptional regulator, AcrR family n=1 Tax=Nonomuraea maritima TaxID=683260 RepID=A0A1G8XUV2_9ACTN|nr:TetR/AcrR family transcriptional regulator [Nonomuraea maritima]SDJ94359.1 DNA-binding transcriptional regulator, AcrR family [Nonomuraea maritima]